MKLQSWLLASLLSPVCAASFAQGNPAPAQPARAQSTVSQKAEALTEAQIKQSHDIAALTKLAQLYNSTHDSQRFIWTLERVSELMPNSGDLKLQLAIAYAKVDDKTKAYDTLLHMQAQGFGYDLSKDPRFEPIHGTKVWDYIVANLLVNAKQFGEGHVAFELPKGDYLFQSLAWDAKRNKLLVGSEREGKIQIADDRGNLTDFIAANAENGMWGIDALSVDAVNGKLYVASSASALYKGFNKDNAGKAGLFVFDLVSGKFLHKYILPHNGGARALTSLAISKDGQVYGADAAHREIYKVDGDALKLLISNQRLVAISGLAVSDDGKTLYLADPTMGIFGFDLTKSTAFDVDYNSASLVLGGIGALYYYEGNLIAIEGSMVPSRVMRLKLSTDGHKVTGAMPIDVAQNEFDKLGKGTLAGDKLYFVANSQRALYDNNGVLTDATALEPTRIFRSNVRFAWGQGGVGTAPTPLEAGSPGAVSKKSTTKVPVKSAVDANTPAKPADNNSH